LSWSTSSVDEVAELSMSATSPFPLPPAAARPIDCLILGTCVADILVRPVPLGTPIGGDRLFHVEPIGVTTGGITCNTGIAMRRLGMRIGVASLVGRDQWGGLVRAQLEAEGIEVGALEPHPTLATSTTAVLIDPGGERSFAHHVGAPHAIDLDFIGRMAPQFRRSRVTLVGYVGLLPSLEPVLAAALAAVRREGSAVALETAGSGGTLAEVAPALPCVDLYVPSLDEARRQTGLDDPRSIVDCYRGHGAAGIVGVKLGTRGVLLSPAAGAFVEIPCATPPGPVADTTGAGDSFLGGLLTGLLRGMPLVEAGRLGAATAACCVTGIGATAGLRSLEETLRIAAG
jgi:sugar/nucleoside kinase (ribokinase family)